MSKLNLDEVLFMCLGNVSLLDISESDILRERVVRVEGLVRIYEAEPRVALLSAILDKVSYCMEPDMEEPEELRIRSRNEPFRIPELEAAGGLCTSWC